MAPRLDLIGLVVKDIETSVRFYRLLGIDVPEVQRALLRAKGCACG